jgi:hypothetical protein
VTEPVEEPGAEGGPDFSACEGLTGLDNAICRHEALLAVDPDNEGLQTALAHLQESRDRHASADPVNGNPHDGSAKGEASGESHGQSEAPHGNAGGNAKKAGGNANGNGH